MSISRNRQYRSIIWGVTHDLLSTGDVISVDFTNDGAIDHIAIITSEKIIQLILNY
ncbi:amidase domain-containing protein [Amedibacterium intestinale]|uniref:amidase domain-containing protein n=1 Tax=Amedibacterium intestinale TaxID=2583452 RepID=UPI000E20BFA0